MDRVQQLREILSGLGLEVETPVLERLLWLLDELGRWNRRLNLTAIEEGEAGLEKHLADSLTLLPLLRGEERLLDLGSGGGFPGLPLKLARPALAVVSVEAVRKKVNFQRHVARTLGLSGFTALAERAEHLPGRPELGAPFEVVVSRALASLERFAAWALPCLAEGGRIIAMKGPEGERELREQEPALSAMGVACAEVRRLVLPRSGAGRSLIVLRRQEG